MVANEGVFWWDVAVGTAALTLALDVVVIVINDNEDDDSGLADRYDDCEYGFDSDGHDDDGCVVRGNGGDYEAAEDDKDDGYADGSYECESSW